MGTAVAAHTTRLKTAGPLLPQLRLPLPIRSGPAFTTMILLAVPVAVVGMAATGVAQVVSALFAGAWFMVLTSALYNRWARLVLPGIAAAFLAVVVATLPFNSPAFVVDFWTATALALLSMPVRGR